MSAAFRAAKAATRRGRSPGQQRTLPLAPIAWQRGVREIEDRTFLAQLHIAKDARVQTGVTANGEPSDGLRATKIRMKQVLDGRRILIAGVSRGIGFETAKTFMQEGARVL